MHLQLNELGWLRENLPNTPILAATATATIQDRQEIINKLRIPRCTQFSMSLNRPNLNYVVKYKGSGKGDLLQDIAEFITSKHAGHTGIVYRQNREHCVTLAKKLTSEFNIPAGAFHAELSTAEKRKVYHEWQQGIIKVVFATVSFHVI